MLFDVYTNMGRETAKSGMLAAVNVAFTPQPQPQPWPYNVRPALTIQGVNH